MHPIAIVRALVFATIAISGANIVSGTPAIAQGAGISSGLPIPRFVSVRNAPSNVRVGPGTNYDIAWTYVRAGVPVEIVQEFDTWRKIRDVEGEEGWVHQNLVVGTRTALVAPWADDDQVALRTQPDAESPVRAWLTPNLLVEVRGCDGRFCDVTLTHASGEQTTRYTGFVPQESLWGVYSNEQFD